MAINGGHQRGHSEDALISNHHQQPSSALIRTHLLISPEIEIDPQSDAIRRNQTQSDLLISPEVEIDPQSDAIRRNQTQSDLLISPEIEANAE